MKIETDFILFTDNLDESELAITESQDQYVSIFLIVCHNFSKRSLLM